MFNRNKLLSFTSKCYLEFSDTCKNLILTDMVAKQGLPAKLGAEGTGDHSILSLEL